jgi:hypothetical protein
VNLGQGTCWPPAFAGGYIWFGGCESGPTVKVDPKTNRAVGQFNGVTPLGAAGSLWILNPDFTRLLRVDPQSGIVLARISPKIDMTQAGGTAGYGSGSVWLYSDTAVSRVDPGTNHVTAVIPLPGGKISGGFPGGYSYGGYGVFAAGRFWVANPAGVYVINPATNAAAKLPLKIQPFSQAGDIYIAAGAGSIWVRTSGNSIARLSPSDGHAIARYPATGGGGGIAVANGALWVANFGNDTVWREPITGSG